MQKSQDLMSLLLLKSKAKVVRNELLSHPYLLNNENSSLTFFSFLNLTLRMK